MNNPKNYYDPDSNTYRFITWCEDHGISVMSIYGNDMREVVTIAGQMKEHNRQEQQWQADPMLRTRPIPFTME